MPMSQDGVPNGVKYDSSQNLKRYLHSNTHRALRKRSPAVPVPFPIPIGDLTIQQLKALKKGLKKLSKKKGAKGAAAAGASAAVTTALLSSGNPVPGVGSTIPLVSGQSAWSSKREGARFGEGSSVRAKRLCFVVWLRGGRYKQSFLQKIINFEKF